MEGLVTLMREGNGEKGVERVIVVVEGGESGGLKESRRV